MHRPRHCCATLLLFASGCATPWEKSALLQDKLPNIDRIQGPQERALRNHFKKKRDEADNPTLAGKSLKPIKGTSDYLSATELFKDEKYPEAQSAFKKVAYKYKKSEIREDALFMEAESAWKQDHYATAHDSYAVLLKEYPSTRHLTVVTERMFKLGRLWLDFPEVAKLGEIKQVNFDDPSKRLPSDEPPQLPKSKALFVPNFKNKKEPLFDTPGNGIAALTSVWMNDPTGPLADDAMMLVASYHARKGNYIEADRFYRMLRETFPHSPHIENAFLLGGHVKLMSYQGPEYESRTLEEAQKLKEATLRLYPNITERDRIQDELARIEEAKALDGWSRVDYYIRKGNKRAACVVCAEVIDNYPKSQYAKLAREKLIEMGPEYASGAVLLNPEETKKPFILDRIFSEPATYFQKKPASKTASRDMSKSGDRTRSGSTSNVKSGKNKRDANDDYDEAEDRDDGSSTVERPNASKNRLNWLGFGRKPANLQIGRAHV